MKRALRWTSSCIQRRIAYRLETMNFAGLDDEDIAGTALKGFAVDRPHSTALADELNLIIRMPVRPRSRTGLAEILVLPCSAPRSSCELPTKGRFSWRTLASLPSS
jgi:hypothetical protein